MKYGTFKAQSKEQQQQQVLDFFKATGKRHGSLQHMEVHLGKVRSQDSHDEYKDRGLKRTAKKTYKELNNKVKSSSGTNKKEYIENMVKEAQIAAATGDSKTVYNIQ